MIGKQMFAMPCIYVFLIKKLSLVIALSGIVLVVQSLQLFATPRTVANQAPLHGVLQARILEWVAISFSKTFWYRPSI